MVCVELDGPPPVSGMIMSNSCSEPITAKKTDRRTVEPSIGKVTYRNFCQPEAPSISAASSTFLSTD
ncbi:hypothetical protein D3C72_2475310 [compost metagenome]